MTSQGLAGGARCRIENPPPPLLQEVRLLDLQTLEEILGGRDPEQGRKDLPTPPLLDEGRHGARHPVAIVARPGLAEPGRYGVVQHGLGRPTRVLGRGLARDVRGEPLDEPTEILEQAQVLGRVHLPVIDVDGLVGDQAAAMPRVRGIVLARGFTPDAGGEQ